MEEYKTNVVETSRLDAAKHNQYESISRYKL
jgi:hypothetical protein